MPVGASASVAPMIRSRAEGGSLSVTRVKGQGARRIALTGVVEKLVAPHLQAHRMIETSAFMLDPPFVVRGGPERVCGPPELFLLWRRQRRGVARIEDILEVGEEV